MDYLPLGSDGPRTSRLSLGTNNFGKQLDEASAKAVVSKALDLGINMIDTADVYNGGRSEEIVGKAVAGNRSQVMIATKGGIVTDGGARTVNLSAKYIGRRAFESLHRLKTDYVDLYYLHSFDPDTPLEESLGALDKLVKDGKVRHVGVSNFTAGQLEGALKVCDERGYARPVAMQNPFSLLARDAERDLIPFSASRGTSFFAYSPLWGGLLTGKYARGTPPPKGSRGDANRRYRERVETQGDFGLVDRLKRVSDGAGVSLAVLALAWVLHTPGVTAPVAGASTPEQLVENCRSLDVKMDPKVLSEIGQALG